MVVPIGIKTGTVVDRRTVSVGLTSKVEAPAKVETTAQVAASGATELAQTMAARPPVDAERVARIKKAIEDGNFPLVPSTVADRLLALKLDWNPNDAA